MNTCSTLLRSASRRLRWAAFGRWFHASVLVLAGVALAGVLGARLLSVLPAHWFTPLTLAVVPGAALLAALALTRRSPASQVARVVDERAGTKELFLAASLMGEGAGEYRELVEAEAARKAADLKAARLLPLRWGAGARDVLLALAVLNAAVLWLPRWDPFHLGEKRQVAAKQEQRLLETKKITALRQEELAQKGEAFTAQVEQELAKLDQTLKEAKPEQKEINAKKLNEEAQDFSELWKHASAQVPKDALEKAAQQFGDAQERADMREMMEKLKQGDAEAVKQAMEKLQQEMQRIAAMPDGADKKEQLEKLAKELGKMASQLREQLGDQNVDQALARALEQMDLSKNQGLSKEALEAANESLKLSKEELEHMGQMFKDMKNVQDALKNLQMAKQLNEKGGLDGKDAQGAGAQSQSDYEKLYQELLAKRGQGGQPGEGNGPGQPGRGRAGDNPGQGYGGTVGEDPNAKTAMKDEKTNSQIGAGKLLMQWNEEGVGDVGRKSDNYQEAVRAVKQGVAEAIRSEQVPPGYHSAIQKYFDRLPDQPAPK